MESGREFNQFQVIGKQEGKWVIDLAQLTSIEVLEESIKHWELAGMTINPDLIDSLKEYIKKTYGE